MTSLRLSAALILLAAAAVPATAQSGIERANWAQAERFSSDNIQRVTSTPNVQTTWVLETDSLWYEWSDDTGRRFHLVVPQGPRRQPLFDHQRMAELLSRETGIPIVANNLPIEELEFEEGGRRITFEADSTRFAYDLDAQTLVRLGEEEDDEEDESREWRTFSPDSSAWAYAEEHNLYLVEVRDGMQLPPVQLTTDGEEDYSFGSRDPDSPFRGRGGFGGQGGARRNTAEAEPEPDSIARRVAANVTWSEDGEAFFVTRGDARGIDVDIWLIDFVAEPRPELRTYDKTLPGDPIPYRELHVYRRGDASLTELPQVHRWKDQTLTEIHWAGESDRLRLIRRDRPWQNLDLIEVDLNTGAVRTLISERMADARLEGGSGFGNMYTPRYLAEGGDFLWWSERSGWGHFYLYDHDGELRHAVTSGAWRAENIEAIDSTSRVIWITGLGREPDENPYYEHIYRTPVDRPQLTLLNPGDYAHDASLSPSRRFILDSYSRVDVPWVSVLRDRNGRVVLELEEMDISRLVSMGWQPPEPFVVKAADGVTDIYGNMWKPFDFDPSRRYPIIASVYPGPQSESVSSTFSANSAQQRLAQLGFIVVQIGNRGGSPKRSAAYRNFGFQNLRDYGLPDKKVGLEQLAARHPFIDLSRVGIFGHSGGGFMTAAALLVPPFNEFFTVGVASNGNHDNNVYSDYWAEQNHGLTWECVAPEDNEDVADGNGNGGAGDRAGRGSRARTNGNTANDVDAAARNGVGSDAGEDEDGGVPADVAERRRIPGDGYCAPEERVEWEIDVPTNADVAENLKGRLMVAFSDQDNNVHPANSVRLIDALIRANKRFDMLLLPGQAHGFGPMNAYFQRRRDEFFAEHLLGDDSSRTGAVEIQ